MRQPYLLHLSNLDQPNTICMRIQPCGFGVYRKHFRTVYNRGIREQFFFSGDQYIFHTNLIYAKIYALADMLCIDQDPKSIHLTLPIFPVIIDSAKFIQLTHSLRIMASDVTTYALSFSIESTLFVSSTDTPYSLPLNIS